MDLIEPTEASTQTEIYVDLLDRQNKDIIMLNQQLAQAEELVARYERYIN